MESAIGVGGHPLTDAGSGTKGPPTFWNGKWNERATHVVEWKAPPTLWTREMWMAPNSLDGPKVPVPLRVAELLSRFGTSCCGQIRARF